MCAFVFAVASQVYFNMGPPCFWFPAYEWMVVFLRCAYQIVVWFYATLTCIHVPHAYDDCLWWHFILPVFQKLKVTHRLFLVCQLSSLMVILYCKYQFWMFYYERIYTFLVLGFITIGLATRSWKKNHFKRVTQWNSHKWPRDSEVDEVVNVLYWK